MPSEEIVRSAMQQLAAENKNPSIEAVRAICGGSARDLGPMIKRLKAERTTHTGTAVADRPTIASIETQITRLRQRRQQAQAAIEQTKADIAHQREERQAALWQDRQADAQTAAAAIAEAEATIAERKELLTALAAGEVELKIQIEQARKALKTAHQAHWDSIGSRLEEIAIDDYDLHVLRWVCGLKAGGGASWGWADMRRPTNTERIAVSRRIEEAFPFHPEAHGV